jgi:hypothetical protein
MSDNLLAFPGNKTSERPRSISSSGRPYRVRGEKNRFTLLFRSRESILESDEAELVRDVCFDIDRAQAKLERIRSRLKSLQEYAATEIQMLTDADAKLSAAIVAALPSTREKSDGS